jgi:hypothetical protein
VKGTIVSWEEIRIYTGINGRGVGDSGFVGEREVLYEVEFTRLAQLGNEG